MIALNQFECVIEENIAHLSFDRTSKANSLNIEAWEELGKAFNYFDKDENVRVIILKGNGKNFSGGMDLEALMSLQSFQAIPGEARKREKLSDHIRFLQNCINAIEKCRKPVIAAIHGACIGGAVDIIAACDLRYASSDAYFSIKEIDLGMVADLGTLQRLPKFMPLQVVSELALTGKRFDGPTAKAYGLVNEYYKDKSELESEVLKTAAMIASKSPVSIRGIKQMLLYSRDHSVNDSLEAMVQWNASYLLSNDLLEAFSATMEKRKPIFKN